ncbi:MAG: type II toxin-antitoxin system VapC family toxin [Oscillospiraceae bacterium]|nr:type II toxin-antitoxin system VapC family toxin [Oscillospiraceae bacterium]
MKKLKVYLDTSVVSHLFADDTPGKMEDTNKLWEDFKADKYDIYISALTAEEIQKCSEPKRTLMTDKLGEIDFQVLEETDEINNLADEYVNSGVLPKKSTDDCLHMAYAVVTNCDIIISWNFKHLVNYRTINKVKVVNTVNHYKEISIISPTMLLEGGDENEG